MERTFNLHGDYSKVYSISVIKEKKVINDNTNATAIVLFYELGMVSVLDQKEVDQSQDIGSVTMFDPIINGKKYTFYKEDGIFKDKETNSEWTIAGKCTKGKLKGKTLQPLQQGMHFAFAWFSFYPDSELYK